MRIKASIIIFGENLLVKEFEKRVGIVFKKKLIKGDISNFGRYKGHRLPYGSVDITIDDIISGIPVVENPIDTLIDFAYRFRKEIRSSRPDSVKVDIAMYSQGMGGIDLSEIQISKIKEFNGSVAFSFYLDSSSDLQ